MPSAAPPGATRRDRSSGAELLLVLVAAWGVLAFGSVYPWAYWTLTIAAFLAGAAVIASTSSRGAGPDRALLLALTCFGAAALIQVVPVSREWLEAIAPGTAAALRELDPAFAIGSSQRHALSILPAATWAGLAQYASLVVLFAGTVRLLSSGAVSPFVAKLSVLAALVALIGIVQKPLYAGEIYGFWKPIQPGSPFGPFVNRNHFAGWMILALPLSLGLVCAGIDRAMADVRPGWRHRVLWMSSPEANRLVLLGAGCVLMALSLLLTMSRSGILALALALGCTGTFIVRGGRKKTRKAAALGYLAVLAVLIVAVVGADAIAARLSSEGWGILYNRSDPWTVALGIARQFPVAGTGLNTYEYAMLVSPQREMNHFYSHAHNGYLELAAEGGVLLLAPFAACVVIFVRQVVRLFREDRGSDSFWLRAGAVTALVAIGFQEIGEFSLQLPGNAALFALVSAVAIHRRAQRLTNPPPSPPSFVRLSSTSQVPVRTP